MVKVYDSKKKKRKKKKRIFFSSNFSFSLIEIHTFFQGCRDAGTGLIIHYSLDPEVVAGTELYSMGAAPFVTAGRLMIAPRDKPSEFSWRISGNNNNNNGKLNFPFQAPQKKEPARASQSQPKPAQPGSHAVGSGAPANFLLEKNE